MSADRVWVTKQGFVRYGRESGFRTLGSVKRNREYAWEALGWGEEDDADDVRLGTYEKKSSAVEAVVLHAKL